MPSSKRRRKLIIGVTGGIGSGKSLVCQYIHEFGGKIFFADKIARDLYLTSFKLRKELVKQFGEKILDQRKRISLVKFREIVFSSDANQKRVNRIVHPFVIKEILKKSKSSKSNLLFVEAALIFESGFNKHLDYVVEVFAPVNKRVGWIRKRNKMPYKMIGSIMKLQMKEREKIKRADFVIRNTSDRTHLKKLTGFLYYLLIDISVDYLPGVKG